MPDTSTTTRSGPRRRLALAGPIAVLVALALGAAPAQAAPPTACFTVTPASPLTGEATVLDSTCSTDDHAIEARAWDLDNDGSFDDGTTTKVTTTWTTPGTYTVRLGVIDPADQYDIETKTIVVRNRAPAAAFTISPSATQATGQAFTFTSTATDPDGTIQSQAWDLDGDATADFNDGTAATASKSFPTAGTYPIRLRVTDNSGATHTITQNVTATNRAPTAAFTISPSATQATGQAFTFTSTATDPDGTIQSQAWDLDGDATADFNDGTGATAAKSFATAGTYPIRLRVTDNNGAIHTTTQNVTATNRAPTAAFTSSPVGATTASTIVFTSTSTDPDGTIQTQAWDTDGDATVDFNDGTATTASKSFATAGTYPIRLRVTDNNGATNITTRNVVVGNRSPRAVFSIDPASILEGDTVTLTSSSADPDGFLVSQAWDTDGDGAYDDGSGSIARFTAGLAGNYEVGLRVVDDKGAWTVTRQTITVGAPPPLPETRTDPGPQTFDIVQPNVTTPSPAEPEPPAPAPVAPYRFLDPFPVVRMKGRTTSRGVRLTAFTVRAPHGSLAQLTCKGGACPFKRVRRTIKTKSRTGSATIHFKQAERSLRAGVELQVAVTQEGMVGKFTRIKVRRMALPLRSDRCLLPGSTRPSTCPAAG